MTKIDERYYEPIWQGVLASVAVSPAGAFFPGIDMAGMTGIWTTMITRMASRSDQTLNGTGIAKIVTAAIGAAGSYQVGSKIFTWTLTVALPGVGFGTAMAANSFLNAVFTLKLGRVTAKHFDSPSFDSDDVATLVIDVFKMVTPIPTAEEIAMLREILG